MPTSFCTEDRIVITGIGIIASVGRDRESVWRAVRQGKAECADSDAFRGVPADLVLGAEVDLDFLPRGRMKVFPLSQIAAGEALDDARIDVAEEDGGRFGCFMNAHMGDTRWVDEHVGAIPVDDPTTVPWCEQFLPNTACVELANHFGLYGPRLSYSTACAAAWSACCRPSGRSAMTSATWR